MAMQKIQKSRAADTSFADLKDREAIEM